MKTRDDPFLRLRRDVCSARFDDRAFDRLYPPEVRAKSARFWTPVEVAHRAAELFAGQGIGAVLDVGSGAGKFCLVAACAQPEISFTGIEHRPHLVEAARLGGARLGLDNAHFIAADVTSAPWGDFDGLYLYNPFAENVYDESFRLDGSVELSKPRFVADVGRVLVALTAARVGTCLVTYNGFGGPIPASYELAHAERLCTDWLRLWVKRRPTHEDDTYHVEGREGVTLTRAAWRKIAERKIHSV